MLLRDDRQLAVNTVETWCFETADAYISAASKVGSTSLATMFERLAERRRQLALALAGCIRALDDLPMQPDPDREVMQQMLSGLKAFLAGDARAVLIKERLQAEDNLAAAVFDALRYELPSETRKVLHDIQADTESARRELAAARASPPGSSEAG